MNRTDRLYALVEELRAVAPRPRSTTWLAAHFEVSSRTIERDLSALQQSGVPIFATPGRRGGYGIDTQHTLPPLNLTASEVTAIATALASDASTPFTHAGRSAMQKILAVLAEADADGTRELAARIRMFDKPREVPRHPPVVEHAIAQRRLLELDYTDKVGVPSVRLVEPVAMIGIAPQWYLWAWCRLRDAPRAFRLDRIRGARMLDEQAPDRGMDPASVTFPDLVGRGVFEA